MDHERELLMIPGPTIVSPRVLRALSRTIYSHGSGEFVESYIEALNLQKELFQTKGVPFMLSGSGTLGMEAAASNLIEKGDKVLCIENGFFGEKWAEIITPHGGEVNRLSFDWGKGIDLKLLEEKLFSNNYKAVTVEHVDTSTGIANPIQKIGDLMKNSNALFIVDSVCGIGGMPIKMDEWNIDFCLTGSQKAIGAPPGMSLFCLNEKSWRVIESRKTPISDYYTNLKKWRPIMENPKKYFATPATGMVLGMLEALKIIHEEGLEKRWKRHEIFSEAFQLGLREIGLESFPDKNNLAHTLSVPIIPEEVNDVELRNIMMKKYNVIIAGGLGKIAGKTIRIGHMGSDTINDISATLAAMEAALYELNYLKTIGNGVGAAMKIFSKQK
ncbi:alanine--glyoxylate aminotransferase family protein [Candidatus Bathyarchaeota archaeon]|nr:alanine--glyoxylate aminotransferase family protein [Candidatus Bathyarchaeota archaeon]